MVRISKQEERRGRSPRKSRFPSPKTGPLKDNLPLGYKEHTNCTTQNEKFLTFIPKVKSI